MGGGDVFPSENKRKFVFEDDDDSSTDIDEQEEEEILLNNKKQKKSVRINEQSLTTKSTSPKQTYAETYTTTTTTTTTTSTSDCIEDNDNDNNNINSNNENNNNMISNGNSNMISNENSNLDSGFDEDSKKSELFKTPSMIQTEQLVAFLEAEEERQRLELAERDERLAKELAPKTCIICMDELDPDFVHTFSGCEHQGCRDCLIAFLKGKIMERKYPLTCPGFKCKSEVTEFDLEILLDKATFERYLTNSLGSIVEKNPINYSCCPSPGCDYVFFITEADTSPDFKCPTCKKRYCLSCKVEWHVSITCEAYQQWSIENGQSDDLFGQFIAGSKFKQCPRCKRWVEKVDGCDAISCNCGANFCYRCGELHDGHNACEDGRTGEDDEGEEEEEY